MSFSFAINALPWVRSYYCENNNCENNNVDQATVLPRDLDDVDKRDRAIYSCVKTP